MRKMRKKTDAGTTRHVGRDALTELALDLRWSWHHGTDELWSELEPELWALTHNPWVVLQTTSPARIGQLLARPASRTRIERLLARRRGYHASPAWFQQTHAPALLTDREDARKIALREARKAKADHCLSVSGLRGNDPAHCRKSP